MAPNEILKFSRDSMGPDQIVCKPTWHCFLKKCSDHFLIGGYKVVEIYFICPPPLPSDQRQNSKVIRSSYRSCFTRNYIPAWHCHVKRLGQGYCPKKETKSWSYIFVIKSWSKVLWLSDTEDGVNPNIQEAYDSQFVKWAIKEKVRC